MVVYNLNIMVYTPSVGLSSLLLWLLLLVVLLILMDMYNGPQRPRSPDNETPTIHDQKDPTNHGSAQVVL